MVTDLQKETIRALFGHWHWEIVEINDDAAYVPQDDEVPAPDFPEGVGLFEHWDLDRVDDGVVVNPPEDVNPPVPVDNVPIPEAADAEEAPPLPHPIPAIQPVPGVLECPDCLCSPCVLQHPQHWFGRGQAPRAGNRNMRKVKYKLFWKMLDDRGAWYDYRYIAKKEQRRRDDNFTVWSRREIMPDCVVNFVRGLYPNLPNMPYMGHKWI